jgi:replicative DNA helicase
MSVVVAIERQTTLQQEADTPQNLEVEQALLGCLMLNNASLEYVADGLRPHHFSHPAHSRIYESIERLVDRGQVADPISLKAYLVSDPHLATVGGPAYLVDLMDAVITLGNVADYSKIIFDSFLRRQLITVGHELVTEARQTDLETSAIAHLETAEKKLFDLATTGQFNNQAVSFHDALAKAIETAEVAYKRDSHVVGMTTGFADLDNTLGGLHPSDLVILAGRPSMGKTALATNIAFNAAYNYLETHQKDGANVAFFSLEMSAEQLATRILSSESRVSSDRIRRGEISSQDFPTFVEVSRRIGSIGLHIDDTPALTISALRNRARRLKRQHNIGFIVIDYLQLLEGGGKRGGSENRVQEISEITRSLKAIAKELHLPVLALSQLSRAVEQRDDKRPQLADLRESGSIEQDADVVMFVFREEYYEARREPPEGTDKHAEWQAKMAKIYNRAEVIVAKQRHGPIGSIPLFFDGRFTKFGNLTELDANRGF